MMPPKDISKNRKALSLGDKIKLLDYYKETKCSIRKLAKHFDIGKTQAGFIIKQEQILYAQWLSGSPNIVRKRLSNFGLEIDKKIHDWYLAQKKDSQDITGPILQNKALEFARNLGYDSFKASNGWLAKFLKRHGISFRGFKNQGQLESKEQKKSNDYIAGFDEWQKTLSSVIDDFTEDYIFTAVQTGLFFRTAPDDTSYLLEKTCVGGSLSAERLTILFCASMSGIKEKPLVISDISKLEIENMKLAEVDCKSNSSAWLTKNIMNEWLTDLDNRLVEQDKYIVLFLDHSLPCYDCQLLNIRTIYFPAVSSHNQRINQCIIKNFKIIYRLQVLKYLIALKEKDLTDSLLDHIISLPQALTWINFSWEELSQSIIHKAFEEFLFNLSPDSVCDEEASFTLNDISDLLCAYDSLINAADYVSIDDCLVTEETDSKPVDDVYAGSDTESKDVVPNNNISDFYYESLRSLKQLELFYLSQNDSNGALLVKQLITHHENVINCKNIPS